MKTYVITLSKKFMKGHPRAGQETDFASKFAKGQLGYVSKLNKIHTIRCNYDFWEKRIKEIEKGNAILSIRQWTGKPYRSKQDVIANLSQKDGVGIQMLDCSSMCFAIDGKLLDDFDAEKLASNDGLSLSDWKHWFDVEKATGKKAIIHFTNFRY